MNRRRCSWGVVFFAWAIIATSVNQMGVLARGYRFYVDHYAFMLPPFWAMARYGVSWSLRFIGIAIAIGLLKLDDRARRAGIVFFAAMLLLFYWSHPYVVFENSIRTFIDLYPSMYAKVQGFLSFETLVRLCWWIQIGIDSFFFLGLIFFLTRPAVNAQFRRRGSP